MARLSLSKGTNRGQPLGWLAFVRETLSVFSPYRCIGRSAIHSFHPFCRQVHTAMSAARSRFAQRRHYLADLVEVTAGEFKMGSFLEKGLIEELR